MPHCDKQFEQELTMDEETIQSLQKKMRNAPPPEWLVKMKEHYAKTGTCRSEDLRRLLGDPTRTVEIGPNVSLSRNFGIH